MGYMGICSGAWSTTLLPLLSVTLVLSGLFLTVFFPPSPLCSVVFFPFSNVYPEMPPAVPMVSAVSCNKCTGAIRHCLCPAWGNHPATKGLLPISNTKRKNRHLAGAGPRNRVLPIFRSWEEASGATREAAGSTAPGQQIDASTHSR